MPDFHAPVDDILFSLTHVAGASRLPDWDAETAADILRHFGKLAEDKLSKVNEIGDRVGAKLENGRVTMPPGFKDAYDALAEGGWQGLTAPEAYGGMDISPVMACGVWEIFSGANHALQMVCNLVPGATRTILKYGSQAQKDRWINDLASGHTVSTMCLSEPQAGSDLAAIRCRATQSDGGQWSLSGEKIFISGCDQDLSEGILHMALARSGPALSGLAGLSLFLCPAGPQAKVTRLEEKLGLKASPTGHMVFEDAPAELIGPEGKGLEVMFTLMNHARIDVALQGVGHAARAADLARSYAEDRTQGRGPGGAPACLIDHPDVARMCDQQDILAIGTRAMCHAALVEIETDAPPALAEFLTSLCKVIGSQSGITSADLGIQIMGGYGYLAEYGMEQILRDARVTAIYEGANGIHTRALSTRGLRPGGGAEHFLDFIRKIAPDGGAEMEDDFAAWQGQADEIRAEGRELEEAHAFAKSSAHLFQRAIWSKLRAVQDHHPAPEKLARLTARMADPGHFRHSGDLLDG